MIKVIILNGPPGCGKDTLGGILLSRHPGIVSLVTFKQSLIEDTAKYFGVPLEWFRKLCGGRIDKEESLSELAGKSPREALQLVSEKVMKPLYGRDHYGKVAKGTISDIIDLHENQRTSNLEYIIFTDGGFTEEASVIGEEFDTTIVQLRGRGSFKGDTRSYITAESCSSVEVWLVNGEEELGATDLGMLIGMQGY